MVQGISTRPIDETPIAVIDFETTGLTPGADRVVEVSVIRVDPGREPRLVFDTLVNPHRCVAATEIHGITDADVADAPSFQNIAGELLDSLNGCVVAAYNVYFDIKFLNFEMRNAGVFSHPSTRLPASLYELRQGSGDIESHVPVFPLRSNGARASRYQAHR